MRRPWAWVALYDYLKRNIRPTTGPATAHADWRGGAEERYTYDPRNRLTTHTKGGVTTPLVYDDAGNLLREDFEYLPDGLLKCAISTGMRYTNQH